MSHTVGGPQHDGNDCDIYIYNIAKAANRFVFVHQYPILKFFDGQSTLTFDKLDRFNVWQPYALGIFGFCQVALWFLDAMAVYALVLEKQTALSLCTTIQICVWTQMATLAWSSWCFLRQAKAGRSVEHMQNRLSDAKPI